MSTLETGNVAEVSRETRGWFVGDLVKWAEKSGNLPPADLSPRQTSQVEVKWSDHRPGETRQGYAPPDRCVTLAVLVEGDMTTEFISVSGECLTTVQSQRGDYVIWHGPSYSHEWSTSLGATMVTVRWPLIDPPAT